MKSRWTLGLLVVLAVLLVAVGCPQGPAGPPGPPGPPFIGGLAPGLNIAVNSVVIPGDLRPEVNFTATDDKGYVLALNEFTDIRFILGVLQAAVQGGTPRFTSYTTTIEDPDGVPNSGDEAVQAAYDRARLNGVTQHENGTMTYKFAAAVPAGYDRSATHQVAGQFQRTYAANGVAYPANAAYAFRPDGGAATDTRDVVKTASCDGCHTRLEAHGGGRREVQLCIMCHNRQTFDANTGNALDFPVLIHKIHMGENLPSVLEGEPYQIVGFENAVNDFSTVVFPQDIRHCGVCHGTSFRKQPDYYLTHPSQAGCGSCHDRIWFGSPDATPAGYTDHIIPQVDDTNCRFCHLPTGGIAPIMDSHLVPQETADAPGLALDITDVTPLPPAKQGEGVGLRITFTAKDGAGNPFSDLAALDQVASIVAWPVTEYQTFISETIRGFSPPPGILVNNGDGSYTYTFAATLPAGSHDTFSVAMAGRLVFTHEDVEYDQGTATNGFTLFTLDGSDPVPRREVVANQTCSKCHREVRMHGELREGVELCVMCHNPNTTDEDTRPADKMPPVTVNFKDLIHRIHTGENLSSGYTVYGFRGSVNDFSDVRFPGRREVCTICHVDASFNLPLPQEALSTVVTQGETVVSETLPTRAACTSCHDGIVANVHALLNTDLPNSIETCIVCHGTTAQAAVALVHTIGP